MVVAAKYTRTVERFKKNLKGFYDISDLGELHWVLGIEIKRDRAARTISMSQRAYIESILEEFRLSDASPLSVPAEPGAILGKHQCPETMREKEDMMDVPYARGVGKVMYYYVATGPQIGFIVRVLAQFMLNPGRPHWEALKRVIRYLKGMKDVWLTLGRTGDDLEGYTDADFASQQDRHSISGYVFRYRGSAISWSSKCQTLIALSTTEAEYIAATHAVKEAIWLKHFLGEIISPFILPVPLFCDNNGAIALGKDDNVFHPCTKHIDICSRFIRQCVENREVTMVYVNTNDNPADILTKPLPRAKFNPFCSSMGVAVIGHNA
jgi:Reverse transcriptase (RNA-dependent DNA polymerase)